MFALLLFVATAAALRGMWSPCGLSMLSTLNPVSERARGHRFWATACWYVGGALVGSAVLGSGCALVAFGFGRLDASASVKWSLALAGAAVAVLSDTRVGGWSLPLRPRQVDERWVDRYRRWLYASGYGVQIGSAFATYIMSAAVYLVALVSVLTGSAAQAFAGCLAFGLVRGFSVLVAAAGRTPESLHALIRRVDAAAGVSALAAAAACAVVGVVAAWELAGTIPACAVGVAFAGALAYSVHDAAARAA
ncbi:MAG: hypothetical protein QOJ34_116 [Pseudonocardiales bacterium]|jgi:hypothetical protein|nr:hypothetical protein [Pseudonocardiales bacterium]